MSIRNYTALHLAANLGSSILMKYFVSLKPDFKDYDNNGMTALHLAAYHGNIEMLEMIAVECPHVDFEMLTKDGKTIYDIANERRNVLSDR